jgi:competence protein ComEC
MAERGRARTQGVAGTWPPREAAQAGGFVPSGFSTWPSLAAKLREWVAAEAGAGRLLPWVPIAFGTGIAFYFTAAHEPVAWVTAATAAALCLAAFLLRRQKAFPVAVMIAAMSAGFATATWKTVWVAHGVLARPVYSVSLTGFVETRDIRERTDRFVLRVVSMDSPRAAPKLERVRLSVRKGTAPDVGSFVELKARLQPPLAPLRPGSYDFGRDMFFQGIGASGFAMGAIRTVEPPVSGGLSLRYAAVMQDLRDAIDARIHTTLDGDKRAIATALLTGRRDAITTPVNDAMFISGLGHVLSISGYHMAVVAGVVFFAVRALLALIPALATGFPIKKWSAAAALAAALFYLLLSGAEVATQRSFFMTAVVLIAVMVDRRAVTFRTLAVAAMIVLAMAPEALVHPSFQMSFAATLGLVALIQIGMPRLFASPDHSMTAKVAMWGGRELMMLTLASFVAGLATTPYAAFHFHRVTPYGVLANLAAMPVVSAVVMPAGLLGLLAMPFGFDGGFWWLMGVGIDWMIAVTRWVADLPGAIGRMAAFGTGPLIAASLGIILLGLLRTPLRWSGAAVLVLAVAWALALPQPDILISADGHNVGVRGKDGRLHLMRTAKDNFLLKEWLAADADPRGPADPSLADGVSCDETGCVAEMAKGGLVALALKPEALSDDCARAALLVTARQAPASCSSALMSGDRWRRQGAIALWRRRDSYVADAVRPRGSDRPWSPAVAEDGEAEPGLVRPASPRAIDATPAEADLQAEE